MLIFFAHAINIICHEVDRLSERVSASAKDLNGLTHELDITFCETFVSTIILIRRKINWFTETAISNGSSLLYGGSLLLLANPSHFNLGSSVLIDGRLVLSIIVIVHHCFGLLDQLALALILELATILLLELLTLIFILLRGVFILHITITDELLVAHLLLHSFLLLLHISHLVGFSVLLSLPLGFLLLDALILFLLASFVSLLLLFTAGILFGALVLLSFCGGSLFLGSLSFHLLAHGLLVTTIGSTVILLSGTTAQDLLHVWGRVDAGGSCTEQ